MKKAGSLLVAFLLMLGLLAGCGGTAGDSSTGTPGAGGANTGDAGGEEEVTLTFLHHMGEQGKKDGLVALAEAFNEIYPHISIEVEFLSMDDFINQYKQRVAADNAPDFVNYRPFQAPELITAGLIEPLDASIFPSNIDTNCIESISLDGKIYGVPLDRGGYGFYYNKTQLEDAGVDPAELNTISGVLEACEKLLAAGYTPLASGYAESWTENIIIEGQTWAGLMTEYPNLCADLMSGETSFDDYPEFVDIITHGQALVRDYAVVDEQAASQQASDQYAQFGRGDAAMMMQGTWAISDIRIAQAAAGNTDEFGFTIYPWSDDESKNYLPANADDAFMISADSKHKEEALLFATWCMSEEAGKIWANASGCISAISGVTADEQDPLVDIFMQVMDDSAYYFEMNPGMTGQYYQDFIKLYIQGRISNESPEQVIAAWQDAFDNIRATGG